jgi:hypothetical protein
VEEAALLAEALPEGVVDDGLDPEDDEAEDEDEDEARGERDGEAGVDLLAEDPLLVDPVPAAAPGSERPRSTR